LSINVAQNRSGDDAAEEWSTPFNWEKDPAIKAEWRTKLFN